MFIFTLLSTFLVLSRICTVGDEPDWDSPRPSASTISTKNIHGHALYIESAFYGDFAQPPRRRLLEYPRWIKQAYRSNDYNVVRKRHRPRNKFDEGRFYRSAVKDDEDKNENEEEEEEEEEQEEQEEEDERDEEDKINDEGIESEEAEDEDEAEMVAAAARSGSRNRVPRSGYVPYGDKVGERDRQEIVRVRSATEKCEDETTESLQYYEYETEVRNVASQDGGGCRVVPLAKMLGASFLIFLLT